MRFLADVFVPLRKSAFGASILRLGWTRSVSKLRCRSRMLGWRYITRLTQVEANLQEELSDHFCTLDMKGHHRRWHTKKCCATQFLNCSKSLCVDFDRLNWPTGLDGKHRSISLKGRAVERMTLELPLHKRTHGSDGLFDLQVYGSFCR